jgi:superfamily II DNA/RNA helicase
VVFCCTFFVANREHLSAAAQYTAIRVAAAVGGLAQPKQVRLLDAHPDILVATPGRLHELIHDLHHVYLSRLERLQVGWCCGIYFRAAPVVDYL